MAGYQNRDTTFKNLFESWKKKSFKEFAPHAKLGFTPCKTKGYGVTRKRRIVTSRSGDRKKSFSLSEQQVDLPRE